MFKKIIILVLSIIMYSCFTASVFSKETTTELHPKEADSLSIVLDFERTSNTDMLLLRNGDQLTGTILNGQFSIRTSYSQLQFKNKTIAGIDLDGGTNNIESIITVNNNRFSGFIDEPVFEFKLLSGPTIKVRREKVLKAIFRIRESEQQGILQRRFVILKNGDFFSGDISNENFMISTTYADIPVVLNDAESIRLIGNENPFTKITMLNGDVLQGVLKAEDIEINLDVGPEVKIYKGKIDIIYCREGYVPYMATAIRSGATGDTANLLADMVLTSNINPAKTPKPAIFPHKKHQEIMQCGECHHSKDSSGKKVPYTNGMKIEKCEFCHNINSRIPERFSSFKKIAHASCKECHKSKNVRLTQCTVCHPKNLISK